MYSEYTKYIIVCNYISLYHLRLSSGYLDGVHFCAFGRSDLDGDKANPWHHLSYSPESSLSAEQAWRCRSRVDVGSLNVRLESKELFEKHRKAMVTMRSYCGFWNVSIWFSNSSSKPRDSIFSKAITSKTLKLDLQTPKILTLNVTTLGCFYWLVVPTVPTLWKILVSWDSYSQYMEK